MKILLWGTGNSHTVLKRMLTSLNSCQIKLENLSKTEMDYDPGTQLYITERPSFMAQQIPTKKDLKIS